MNTTWQPVTLRDDADVAPYPPDTIPFHLTRKERGDARLHQIELEAMRNRRSRDARGQARGDGDGGVSGRLASAAPAAKLFIAAALALLSGDADASNSGSNPHAQRRTTCAAQRRAARTRRNIRARAPKRKAVRA